MTTVHALSRRSIDQLEDAIIDHSKRMCFIANREVQASYLLQAVSRHGMEQGRADA